MERTLWLACLCALCLAGTGCKAGPTQPTETGNAYAMECTVREDGALEVTERLTVDAREQEISHGVWREFPQELVDCRGGRVAVEIEVLEVLRNGEPAPHHRVALPGVTRFYVGEQEARVEAGRHTYALTYRTSPVVETWDARSRLCWDIAGEGLTVPLRRLRAEFHLPRPIPPEELRAECSIEPPEEGTGAIEINTYPARVQMIATTPVEDGRTLRARISWPAPQTAPAPRPVGTRE